MKIVKFLFFALLALSLNVEAREIVVEPNGLSMHAALLSARAMRQADPSQIVMVRVRKGRYLLKEPLVLTPADSGIRWLGEDQAVISGEQIVEGWKSEGNGIVSAPIPEDFKAEPLAMNQLWVNGQRASNSIWPKNRFLSAEGYSQYAATNAGVVSAYKRIPVKDDEARSVLSRLTPGEFSFARLLMRVKWTCSRHRLSAFDQETNILSVKTKKLCPPWAMPSQNSRLCLENVRYGFTEPGDWFCDVAAGRIFYRLRSGERIEQLSVKAPRAGLSQLVRVEGVPGNQLVSDLVFSNLTFTVTAATAETLGLQAANSCDAVIQATGLVHSSFVDCRVTHTGNYAFRLEDGCVSNTVMRCHLDDLGAGGLWIGAIDKCLPSDVAVKRAKLKNNSPNACKFNRVDDCTIEHGGLVNTEGVGVVIGHASDCTITHCEIADFEYSGVSAGWIWGYAGSIAQRNEISFNRIHDLGKGLMDDLAGVYTLSTSFGTCVSNNVIYNVSCSPKGYGGWGLYCDEGAEGIVMENNVVWNTTDGSFHQHYGTGCQIRNNILAYNGKEGAVKATNQNPFQHVPSHINVYGNIVLVKGKGNPFIDPRTFGVIGPWACNLWWNEDSEPIFCANCMKLDEWKRRGIEIGGVVANPCFVDAPNHDFRLKPDSPAFGLGFREWDISMSGRRK